MAIPGTTMTALDLIKSALRSINVLAAGENPSADEGQDSLVILNQMIDSWNADGLMIFSEDINDFPLSSNQQVYSYGPGGDFDAPRPVNLDRASIVILSNPAQPLEYPIPIYTDQDWQEKVPIKNVPGNLPLLIYDDGGFPLRNVTFWPVASDATLFRSYVWQKLTQFTSLQSIGAFPEGYIEAMRHNLAVRLAPEFQAQLSPATVELARSGLAVIKGGNADDTQLRSDLMTSETPSKMRSELFNIP